FFHVSRWLVYSVYLFSLYRCVLFVHSFPTRRSSDLYWLAKRAKMAVPPDVPPARKISPSPKPIVRPANKAASNVSPFSVLPMDSVKCKNIDEKTIEIIVYHVTRLAKSL